MDGILLFNKPILWTSHDAVDFVRRCVRQKSVGHAGTLDPLATGLLVMLLGKLTKLSQQFSGLDKRYFGSMTLGIATDTQDLEGRILGGSDYDSVREESVLEVFSELRGTQLQKPPAYSAARKQGKRLYDWARQGVLVEPEPKQITVSRFELAGVEWPELYFSLVCSKGTYVRSLCDRVGQRLGCGATLSSLVREQVGRFNLSGAVGENELRQMPLEKIESILIQNR